MATTRIEDHLLPNDVLKTNRVNKATRAFLIGKGFGSDECLIGKKPSAAPPYARPIHRLEVDTILTRLWDEEEDVQKRVISAFEESLEFEKLKDDRKARFGFIDYGNIGVGNGTGQTREVSRFDVPLSSRIAPAEGHDWAEGYGKAPLTGKHEDLVLPCPVITCDFKTPWGKEATKVMGMHVHHNHEGEKKNWKLYLKEFKKQHEIS